MFLVLLGAGYFFVYIPANEKTVQQRRFTSLQKIDSNIHSKIDNSANFLATQLNSFNHTPAYKALVTNYPKKNFILLYDPSLPAAGNSRDKNDKRDHGPVVDTGVNVFVDNNAQNLILIKSRPGDTTARLGIQFKFKQFIQSLLPHNVFDQYIVFANNKKLYETFPSGLTYSVPDSLLQVVNKITSPGVRSLKIGGTDYKAFTQPVNVGNGNELMVVGLVLNGSYQKEKNQLPLGAVLFLLTIAIVMIVCLPWIKLYNMGNKDKLTVKDGIESVLVSMVLMSLLFFVFFKYGPYLNNDKFKYNQALYSAEDYSNNVLAEKIARSFEAELNAVSDLLDAADSLYAKDATLSGHSWKDNPGYYKVLEKAPERIAADQLFWMNANGDVISHLTNNNPIPDGSNFKTRDYFQRTKNSQPNHIGEPQFYVDQVVSRVANSFTTVVAKSSKREKVVAMSFTAKSLDSVVMPDGYQFAVIDDKGNVLYHSQADRNLNENLVNEFGEKSQFLACIEAKSDTCFATEYLGRQCNLKIKPFKALPYFIIVFEDKEYNDTRDTEAYFFTFSMLICLLIFLIIQFGVVFFVSAKRSFFKKQLFDTSWIGPKTVSHEQYNMSSIANLIIILLLGICYFFSSFLLYLFILLISITFSSLLLNGLFASKYRSCNLYLFNFKKIAIGWLSVFALLINIAAWWVMGWSQNLFWLGVYESVLIALYFIFYFLGSTVLHTCYGILSWLGRITVRVRNYIFKPYRNNQSLRIPWTYTHSFSLMATTRLVITSGIPVAVFFIYSFNYEQNLDARYRQLLFARQLSGKIYHLANNGKDEVKKINDGTAYTSGIYTDNHFINKISEPDSKYRDSITRYSRESYATAWILDAFRIHLNSVEVKNDNMNLGSTGSEAFFNFPLSRAYVHKLPTTTLYHLGGTERYIRLSSKHLSYSYPDWYLGVIFIISVAVFYYVIHNIIRKLFALDLPSMGAWKNMDEELISDSVLNSLLFIVGSPGSGKLTKLKEKINSGQLWGNENQQLTFGSSTEKGNVYIADMILISSKNGEDDPDWKRCKKEAMKDHALVIINHFEYNIKDLVTNSIKLDFLEMLMHKGASKIVIISTVHPVTFLDSFNNMPSSGDSDMKIPENELERWHVLLGHFRIVIEPLVCSAIPEDTGVLRRMVMEETQYSHFLHKMQPMTLSHIPASEAEGIGPISDSLIFKLQLTSQYFYTYIWQSLTKEEKFLLYDLAEDGLVNPYDDHNLTMLICKGLIIKPNGTLMLFNKGFRNFILTAIGNTEANRIKEQVKDNGSWGSLKTPMNLVILAILFFLLLSQQESYSKVITYITTIGAGLTAVLRILPMLSSNNTQKTE
ncbi:MAG TPA: cache domain-containing protein [Mucilaginibacter sp.]|nr:cache domain-containing protein [Mucilaginibacter sp.]